MRSAAAVFLTLSSILSTVSCVDDACDSEETCTDDSALMEQAFDQALADPKADGTDCSGVRVPDRTGFNKHIALTFDDGPNPATTARVIQILHAHHAPATFFNNGMRYTAAGKVIAAQIAADPTFILGNHTQHHIDLAHQTAAKVASEIDDTDAVIRAAGETPKYLRFPFGSANCAAVDAAHARGYTVVGWHIDSADWCYASGNGVCKKTTFKYVPDNMRSDFLAYAMSQARSNNGGIILMHDIHQFTVDHLDALLTQLETEGFSFVRLDNTTVFPHLNGVTPPPVSFIGDACTTNSQCAFTVGGQPGRCHPAGFCTTSCAGSCPDLAGRAGTFCIADGASTTAGICVSKPAAQNALCAALTGTQRVDLARFLGASGAPAAHAEVCAPR